MAVRSASPWWMSLVFLAGLVLLFLGQRAFASVDGLATIATIVGAVLVVGVTAYRVWATVTSRGGRRRVERTLLWCHLGVTFALLLYALSTDFALGKLGLDDLSATGKYRYETAMLVVWGIVMLVSLTVLLMIEVTQGGYSLRVLQFGGRSQLYVKMSPEERAQFSEHEEDVEHLRVRDAAWSGLSIGLAASFLLVTCQVASEKNVRRDVSYFKTSAPGESTRNIVKATPEPLKVLVFFPEVNEVKDEVLAYFTSLRDAAGKITIEEHDYRRDKTLAEKYGITKDGVVMIAKGDLALDDPDPKAKAQVEKIELDTNIDQARRGRTNKLRTFDREVNSALLKLVRAKRKAYLTVGHGEMSDYDSVSSANRNKVFERKMTTFKKRLGELNYEVKELGLIDLVQGVPEDATIVIMLAPAQPLTPEELLSLDRYLEKGGRLLAALDPDGEAVLGPLEGRLGVTFDRNEITDDKYLYPNTHQITDRRWAATTQFSAHASTTALSRSVDKGLLLFNSGALKDVPFTVDADKTKRTYVIRSMTNSWLEVGEDDFKFDEATEKRDRYNVGAAIEGPKVTGADGAEKDGFRAMVFSDGDLFADLTAVLVGQQAILTTGVVPSGYQQQPLQLTSGPLLDDAVKWLGGEEVFAGEVVIEEDAPIKHVGKQETRWFLAMIGGVPSLVLAIGLFLTVRLKRRGRKPTAEATP